MSRIAPAGLEEDDPPAPTDEKVSHEQVVDHLGRRLAEARRALAKAKRKAALANRRANFYERAACVERALAARMLADAFNRVLETEVTHGHLPLRSMPPIEGLTVEGGRLYWAPDDQAFQAWLEGVRDAGLPS